MKNIFMRHYFSAIICQLSDIKSHNQMSKNSANLSKQIHLCEIFNKEKYYYVNTGNNGKIDFLKAIINVQQAMAS